jgi:hypothetical protein
MNSFTRQITSWFLLMAFLFAITPKEFIHEFAGHEDTKDCYNSWLSYCWSLSHHCQILQLQINPFNETEKIPIPVQPVFIRTENAIVPVTYSLPHFAQTYPSRLHLQFADLITRFRFHN